MVGRQGIGRRRAQHDTADEGNRLECARGEAIRFRTGDDDLGGVEPHIQGIEQRGVGEQRVGRERQDAFEQSVGLGAISVAGKKREPHQVLRGERI